MSVLVRGMDMPENCGECCFCNGDWGNYICDRAMTSVDDTGGGIYSKRLYNCPLVEVKTPHGKLVDADRMAVEANEAFVSAQTKVKNHLALMINEATHKKVQMILAYTPSVIEAEKTKNRLE